MQVTQNGTNENKEHVESFVNINLQISQNTATQSVDIQKPKKSEKMQIPATVNIES